MRPLKISLGTALLLCIFLTSTASKVDTGTSTKIPTALELEEMARARKRAMRYHQKRTELQRTVKAYFDAAIASGTIVGAGVGIVSGDSVVLCRGYGKRSVDGTKEVNAETLFRLGSLSKGFTGVLAASLVDDGTLQWDDRVIDYLPEFRLGDLENSSKIKLRHVLSHTAGTPYHSYTNLIENGLPMSAIAGRFGQIDPVSEPGAMYSYQNAMFALSQEMMCTATDREVAQLFEERLFRPLEMCSISMDHRSLLQYGNVAMPHAKRRRGWKRLRLKNRYYNAITAGGINANTADMAKWMHFLLGHRPDVLDKNALLDAFSPIVPLHDHRKYYHRWKGHERSYYGLGWRIHRLATADGGAGTTVWHHGGSVNDYRNEIALFPETDLGICVLLNSNSPLARTVIPDLRELVQEVFGQGGTNVEG